MVRAFKPKVTGALGLFLMLSACGGSETFVSFAGKSKGQIAFCVSEKANCAKPGASIRALQVDQIDETGKVVATVWRIDSPSGWGSNYAVDKIVYGSPPVGWIIKIQATTLAPGKHYRVNNQFYFSLTPNGLVLTEMPKDHGLF